MPTPHAKALSKRLGYQFANPELLDMALTHKSYANENQAKTKGHNERLEFLGDAILDYIVGDLLMARYPEADEGALSKMRAGLVSETVLAQIARSIRLGEALQIGKGEEKTGGREKDSLLSDGLEALIAAFYLDSGQRGDMRTVFGLVEAMFAGHLEHETAPEGGIDHKTALQELAQKLYKETVRYKVLAEEGPDHAKEYQVAVFLRGQQLGAGKGKAKKQAEQAAAAQALEKLKAEA